MLLRAGVSLTSPLKQWFDWEQPAAVLRAATGEVSAGRATRVGSSGGPTWARPAPFVQGGETASERWSVTTRWRRRQARPCPYQASDAPPSDRNSYSPPQECIFLSPRHWKVVPPVHTVPACRGPGCSSQTGSRPCCRSRGRTGASG